MAKSKKGRLGEADRSWQIFKRCQVCGNRICVNNTPTREVNIPRFMGVICCARCWPHTQITLSEDNPYFLEGRKKAKVQLRTMRSLIVAKQLSTKPCSKPKPSGKPRKKCKCVPCTARKIFD